MPNGNGASLVTGRRSDGFADAPRPGGTGGAAGEQSAGEWAVADGAAGAGYFVFGRM